MRGLRIQMVTINGPLSARLRNAISMAFPWRANDGPILNVGLVALWFFRGSGSVLLRNPIFLWFSRGGVRTPCPPPHSGSAHVITPFTKPRSWNCVTLSHGFSHLMKFINYVVWVKKSWPFSFFKAPLVQPSWKEMKRLDIDVKSSRLDW